MSMEIFKSSPNGCGNSSVRQTSKPSTPHGHQLVGDGIIDAPLSCYIVKWRNRNVAKLGLVQLSNLITCSSYNGDKNVAITGSSYNGKTLWRLPQLSFAHCQRMD